MEKNKLLSFEAWYYRMFLTISWVEKLTNEGEFFSAGNDIRFLKLLQIVGHILRHDSLSKRVIE